MNSSTCPTIKETRDAIGGETISNKSLLVSKYFIPSNYNNNEKNHQKESSLGQLRTSAKVESQVREKGAYFANLVKKTYLEENCLVVNAVLKSRLAINLSDSLFDNTGISLDFLSGMPIINGSAVKGVCRVASYLKKNGFDEIDEELFGSDDSNNPEKGKLIFFSATTEKAEISLDILTPHKGDNNPIPNKFPVVEKGAIFTFVLALNALGQKSKNKEVILQRAKESIFDAFKLGLGAKTGAGYGHFEIDDNATAELTKRIADIYKAELCRKNEAQRLENIAKAAAEKERQKKEAQANMSPEEFAKTNIVELFGNQQEFANMAKNISKEEAVYQKVFISLFVSETEFKKKLKTWEKKKPAIYNSIKETAAKFGVNL